jgi:hypothetical protein
LISDEEVRQTFQKSLDIPDVVTGMVRLKGQAAAGFQLDRKISLQIAKGIPPNRWEGAPAAGCIRHMAVFNAFGAIPKYCFECYKVVIAPRTIVELFKLLMSYKKLKLPNDNTRKCMVETRNYSSGSYKGFVYCRGMEDGNEVYRIVRQTVSEDISPEIPVILKRGCSEYGQVYPEYAQMDPGKARLEYKKNWQFYEDFVDANFVFEKLDTSDSGSETDFHSRELFAMQFWLRYAATIGDMSYLIMTGGKVLEPMPKQ